MIEDATRASDLIGPQEERMGWRTLRVPPKRALVFGAVYGAIMGAIVAWDIAVLLRWGKIAKRRVSEEIEARRSQPD
jgi:hypothetical protein